jgi:hypothetical protein
MRTAILRALTETGFIVFLFYSNLLMGEYTHSGAAREKGIAWAVRDVFSWENFSIGLTAALVGYVVVEVLRERLWIERSS